MADKQAHRRSNWTSSRPGPASQDQDRLPEPRAAERHHRPLPPYPHPHPHDLTASIPPRRQLRSFLPIHLLAGAGPHPVLQLRFPPSTTVSRARRSPREPHGVGDGRSCGSLDASFPGVAASTSPCRSHIGATACPRPHAHLTPRSLLHQTEIKGLASPPWLAAPASSPGSVVLPSPISSPPPRDATEKSQVKADSLTRSVAAPVTDAFPRRWRHLVLQVSLYPPSVLEA